MNDLASTALSLNEFWQRSHAKWTHLEERQQKVVADIVNTGGNWHCDVVAEDVLQHFLQVNYFLEIRCLRNPSSSAG